MRNVFLITMVVIAGLFVSLSVCRPDVLANNLFLSNFVNHEILAIMGVIMTVSITSIATIHIWFNELEDKHGKKVFSAARREINQAALYFVWLFVAQLVCLVIRGLPFFIGNLVATSLFNGMSLMLLLMAVLTLIDILGVVKSLTPDE